MKKIIVLILTMLLLISCGNNKIVSTIDNSTSTILDNSTSTILDNELEMLSQSGKIITKKDYDNLIIPNNYKLSQYDVLYFEKAIKNDFDYFKKKKTELDFFYIARDYIYGNNYLNGKLDNLINCLDGVKVNGKLSDLENNICEGKNKYLIESDTNFFHIKDTMTKLKEIKNGGNIDCNYFLKDNYNFPEYRYIYVKRVDYMVCNMIKYGYSYNIYYEDFIYNKSIEINKCNYLNDKNLIKLCNEEIKFNFTNIKR